MANHESRPEEAGIREPSSPAASAQELGPGGSPLPAPSSSPLAPAPADLSSDPERPRRAVAWQPFTFRGVAAFAHAPIGRLLLLQTLVALALAGAIGWFLHHAWFPRILDAIRALPPAGAIENRTLSTHRPSREPLAADGFIAFAVNLEEAASLGSASDLRVEFHRTNLSICSLLGCLTVEYPPGYVIQFNQPDLESWWGAWRLTIIAGVVALSVVFLFGSWWVLATVYAVPVWLAGFFKDRRLSLLGGWKLASAALLAPALGVGGAIVFYGCNAVDLLRLLLLCIVHVPLGWLYLYAALHRVPIVTGSGPRPTNPFAGASPKPPPKRAGGNPFAQ